MSEILNKLKEQVNDELHRYYRLFLADSKDTSFVMVISDVLRAIDQAESNITTLLQSKDETIEALNSSTKLMVETLTSLSQENEQLKADIAMYKQEAEKIPYMCIMEKDSCLPTVKYCPSICPKYKEERK